MPYTARIEQARRHVEGGKRIVAAQEALVATIKERGENIADAQSLLDAFRLTLAAFEDDLIRFQELQRLAKP